MAQASTSPIDNVIDAAAQSSFQVLGLYRQAAKFAIEATGTWLETVGGVIPLGRVQSRLVQPWLRAGLEVWSGRSPCSASWPPTPPIAWPLWGRPSGPWAKSLFEDAADLVHLAAIDSQGGVVVANSLGVGGLEQAVDLAVAVVEQLGLSYAELVALLGLGLLRDLRDRIRGQVELIVEIHEHGHRPEP